MQLDTVIQLLLSVLHQNNDTRKIRRHCAALTSRITFIDGSILESGVEKKASVLKRTVEKNNYTRLYCQLTVSFGGKKATLTQRE